MEQQDLTDRLRAEARKHIPGGTSIVAKAMKQVLDENGFSGKSGWLKENFSLLVEEVQIRAFELYLQSQAPAADKAFRTVLEPLLPPRATVSQFFDLLQVNFQAIDRFFLGLGQGRKARAGGAMESVVQTLIQQIGYPFTPQAKIDGQPDFLFPSIGHFEKMPVDCIIFTVKRTLRERWRQIVTEGSKGLQFFLATIDESVPATELATMKNHRVWIVVPKRVKETKYASVPNALSFEDFFDQHLDPAMVRWKKNRVV